MTDKKIEQIVHILNGIAGIGVVIIAILAEIRLPLLTKIAIPIGLSLVIIGISLVAWSVHYLRVGFFGRVQPRLNFLVQKGPYKFVRHPVYLGWTIALVGVSFSARSLLALIAVFVLFLPSSILRAQLEERALNLKFGEDWKRYAARTGFILPRSRIASHNSN